MRNINSREMALQRAAVIAMRAIKRVCEAEGGMSHDGLLIALLPSLEALCAVLKAPGIVARRNKSEGD